MKRVTRTEFARLCGVSKQAIIKTVKNVKGDLTPAYEDEKIDLDHPAAIAYAAKHGADITIPEPAAKKNTGGRRADRKNDDGSLNNLDLPDDILEYANKSFKEVVAIFATDNRFVDWLKALKLIQEIDGKQIQNRQLQKELISRELVQKHILGYLSAMNERMLQDAPRTIALKVSTLVQAEETTENITLQITDLLESYIKMAKSEATRGLRKL